MGQYSDAGLGTNAPLGYQTEIGRYILNKCLEGETGCIFYGECKGPKEKTGIIAEFIGGVRCPHVYEKALKRHKER